MREVATEGQKGTPGTREDGQLWGAFPNTMTIKDLAAHVVSKLTDAGYSIIPSTPGTCIADPMGTHRWIPFYSKWRCADCQRRRPAAAAEGEKP